MANSEKIETLLRAALDATPLERQKSLELSTGFEASDNSWEIIVKHSGNLSSLSERYPNIQITELLNNYGILRVPANLLEALAQEEVITYIEKPKSLFFEVFEGKRASCVTTLQTRFPELTGRDTLVGIIDSGIDYMHPDFQNNDNTSRILSLWDQSIPNGSVEGSSAPNGYNLGTLFSNETLNNAIIASNEATRRLICPSVDLSGHGTHVTY
ncbi:MAG: S8 family serine peptidase [Lachnospiraceae bacterium]|nr:S8 family serine peptidase [Lachnospiraceae bacterium]